MNLTEVSSQRRQQRKVLIARNPRSGAADRSRLLSDLESSLRQAGWDVEVETSLERLAELGRDPASTEVLRTVISAGGDGTASAVASRLPASVPITLFPLGTENLLARWLGAVAEVSATVDAIQRLDCRLLDAASANGLLSLIMIGVGYDAEVVHQVHQNRKGHITKWAYGWPMFWNAFSYPFPRLSIRAFDWTNLEGAGQNRDLPRLPQPERLATNSDPSKSGNATTVDAAELSQLHWTARWLFVANLPTYAGGLSIVPEAKSDDGYLCAASFQKGTALPGLAYAASIFLRSQQWLSDYRCLRARRFRVESDQEVRFQVDGDDGGTLPLDIQVLPGRVTLVKPSTS